MQHLKTIRFFRTKHEFNKLITVMVYSLGTAILCGSLPAQANPDDAENNSQIQDLFSNLEHHPSVQSFRLQASSSENEGESSSTWDEPRLSLTAKQRGIPVEELKMDPLRFVDLSISQRIPTSNRLNALGESSQNMSQNLHHLAEQTKRELARTAWFRLIEREALSRELSVLQLSLNWLSKRMAVTKSQFRTGQTSQQALLELKVLESELKRKMESIPRGIVSLESEIRYLFGLNLDAKVPAFAAWRPKTQDATKTPAILAAESRASSAQSALRAAEGAETPDLTLQVGYSAALQEERDADMFTVGLSVPLPVRGSRGQASEAKAKLLASESHSLDNLKRLTESKALESKEDIQRLESELRTLESETLDFARSARKIAERSYGLGQSSYVELLNAESTLRRIEMEQISLWKNLEKKRIEHLFWTGAPLWE